MIDFHKKASYTYIVTKTNRKNKCFLGGDGMKRVVVELEDDFHKRVKLQAIGKDMSIKEYLTLLIKKDLETKKE